MLRSNQGEVGASTAKSKAEKAVYGARQTGRKLMKTVTIFVAMAVLILLCSNHSVVNGAVPADSKAEQQLQPTTQPGMVYVLDFTLDVSSIVPDSGVLDHRRWLGEGPLERLGPLHKQVDPALAAPTLVNLLAASIAQELGKNLIPAMRLPQGQALPDSGWLVRGRFISVEEGNRVRRAVIGFGEGATDMQIDFEVCELGRNPLTPFLVSSAESGSGKKPGAIVTMNPYVAAAKFVLAKNASENDVRQAGTEIALTIIKYMKSRGLITAN